MVEPHAAKMDAHHYWRQFPVTAHFLEPTEIIGVLIEHGELRTKEGPIPRLKLQTDDGTIVIVNVSQTRLLAELHRLSPAVGDRIKITYTGEAGRAAPGMSKTKEFTVAVRPRGSRGPDRPDTHSGECSTENGPVPGDKAGDNSQVKP